MPLRICSSKRSIQQGIQQGIQTGIQQGERLVIENLLRARFGGLDPELLSTIDPMLALTPEVFTPLLQLSREELVARFVRFEYERSPLHCLLLYRGEL